MCLEPVKGTPQEAWTHSKFQDTEERMKSYPITSNTGSGGLLTIKGQRREKAQGSHIELN
jgi:hypothetical protein